ncbi:MAG TPA: tetratricopeptide repeat protein [Thermoleophilaceae bacterium]|jgi:tetratricopeptide (TPR) repeat protein
MTDWDWPFVGRVDEQERYVTLLRAATAAAADDVPSDVVLIEGLGGYGKTELIHRFADLARGDLPVEGEPIDRSLVVSIDWQEQRDRRPDAYPGATGPRLLTVIGALHGAILDEAQRTSQRSGWRATLMRNRVDPRRAFEQFTNVAARTRELAELREQAERAAALADQARQHHAGAVGGLAKAGAIALGGPPAGAATELALRLVPEAAGAAAKADITSAAVDEALRPEEALVRAFAAGVRELSCERPVVLLLDTYEIVQSTGRWLREAARHTGGRVVWVIAGRVEPAAAAAESSDSAAFRREVSDGKLRAMRMTMLADENVRRLLVAKLGSERATPELEAAVVAVTRGIPMAVRLVVGLVAEGQDIEEALRPVTDTGDGSEIVRRLAERYLKHVHDDETLRPDAPLLYGLALGYGDRSDPEVLQALWGSDEAPTDTLVELARRHDFVLTASRRLHQEIRDTMRAYLLDAMRRAEVKPANERARAVLLQRLKRSSTATVDEQFANEEWRAAAAALLWHTFWSDNEVGLESIAELFPAASLMRPAFARELVGIGGNFADTFSDRQRQLLRGLGSLLTFGPLVDGWLERRRSIPSVARPREAIARLREDATPADRATALRFVIAQSADAPAVLAPVPPRAGIAALLAAKMGSDDPPERGRYVEEAARTIEPESPLGRELAEIALRARRELSQQPHYTDEGPLYDEMARVTAEYRRDAPAWVAFGQSQFRKEDWDGAIAAFERALELDPESAEAYAGRAGARTKREEWDLALADWDAAIAREPENVGRKAGRGQTLAAMGRVAEALAIHRAPELNDHYHAWYRLSRVLADLDDSEAALEAADRLVALKPDVAEFHGHRGRVLVDLDLYDDALSEFDRAIELKPGEESYHHNRGLTLGYLGRMAEARNAFERAIELNPTDALIPSVVVGLMDRLRQSTAAEARFRAALQHTGESFPEFIRHAWHAVALAALGERDRFLEECALAHRTRAQDHWGLPLWCGPLLSELPGGEADELAELVGPKCEVTEAR